MPKTASKPRPSNTKGATTMSGKDHKGFSLPPSLVLALAAVGGIAFGLSAPGLDQWYLAWCGLVPLFLLISASPSYKDAWLRAFIFGTAYNLTYFNWLTALHPLNWMGLADWQSIALSTFCWLAVSIHQGLIISIFGTILRLIPWSGTFIPAKVEGSWCLPALTVVPLLWTLWEEKIGNAHNLLGVPWSMIEYSQYEQTGLIQIASIIGGIGLSVLIVMVNVALASFIASYTRKLSFKSLAAPTPLHAFTNLSVVALLVASCLIFGLSRMQTEKFQPTERLSILQGNINIEMQKTTHRYSLAELASHYNKMIKDCPEGLCIWTESALPVYLRESPKLLKDLALTARQKNLDMIIGSIDRESGSKPFNSAFGITKNGQLLPEVYHKRLLVPVGEYTPDFVRYLPDFIQRLTDTPAGTGFSAGTKPVVLSLSEKPIAPLVCFETLSPELVVSSVRNGGQLLVNISDLAWFHNSMIGEQTTAFAVFRAIESERYFVYAANTGPSMIINPLGVIERKAATGTETLITTKVSLVSHLTPFIQWFN